MPRDLPAPVGSPDWLRAVPARWGLRQADACRVMGIAASTYRAKCIGRIRISDRLIGRIVDVEMLLMLGYHPFGWPFGRKQALPANLEPSPRTLDHIRNIIERYDLRYSAAVADSVQVIGLCDSA